LLKRFFIIGGFPTGPSSVVLTATMLAHACRGCCATYATCDKVRALYWFI